MNMLHRLYIWLLIFSAVSVWWGSAEWRPAEAAKPGDAAERKVSVTRADLGRSYLRLEQAYFADPPSDGERIAAINQAFDTATLAFFSGQYAKTIEEVDQLTASLLSEVPSPALAKALSLKPTVQPPVVNLAGAQPVEIDLQAIYPVQSTFSEPLRLQLVDAEGHVALERPLEFASDNAEAGADPVRFEPLAVGLKPGSYSIDVAVDDKQTVPIGRLNVVERSLDDVREKNERQLAEIESHHPELSNAIEVCRDRNGLLTDHPSTHDSSQFLANTHQLVQEVDAEIEMLASGGHPYRLRSGDYWRTTGSEKAGKRVPLRVYAPQAATEDKAVPLVVALHGAGGDENMFFEGYGAGVIKELAEKHGVLVASVSTNILAAKPERFDHVLEELTNDYNIDPAAIYLVGHSMGAGATSRLAGQRSDVIAAACCLAGGGRSSSDSLSPMLVIAAELDKIIPAESVRSGAQRAIEAGLPIEFRQADNYGHTLMVGAVLPEAIDWLLAHPKQAD